MRACAELVKDWRMDKYLRKLKAMMIVADKSISLVITGTGDVLEPEDDIADIYSGGNFVLYAAKALIDIPKSILMIGHTGVGKTKIARRLAKLAGAHFLKVEATKITEIGYVGHDVDSIIRDLVDAAIVLVKEKARKALTEKALGLVEKVIVNSMVDEDATEESKNVFRKRLRNKEFEDGEVSINVRGSTGILPTFDIPGVQVGQIGVMNVTENVGKMFKGSKKTKTITVNVKEAPEILINEKSVRLMDEDNIIKEAIDLVSHEGIVFLDEIDKIAARTEIKGEVNREGVQRDLLPLLEGTTVSTKYGPVKTDFVLLIASGAFHLSKPFDLLPELQCRLQITVELKALTQEDLIKILKEPESSLLKQ